MGNRDTSQTRLAQFWAKVNKVDGDGCWEWTGCCFRHGYGAFALRGTQHSASRAAWLMLVGPIDDPKTFVCHTCDNRRCVRIDHLFLGTAKDNNLDCAAKGRNQAGDRHYFRLHPEAVLRGEKRAGAKLTADSVLEIRKRHAAGERQKDLAAAYGVSPSQICTCINGRGKTWRHVA